MAVREETLIRPAQGRPMLWWVGKQPITRVPVFPAQHGGYVMIDASYDGEVFNVTLAEA